MNLQSVLIVVVLAVFFLAAIWFISKQGGWGGGCGGDCAHCGSKCEAPKPQDPTQPPKQG